MSNEFHSLRIAERRNETTDAISLVLDIREELQPPFSFEPGQHLTLRSTIDGEEVRRNYSLCSSPHEGEWRVAVKRMPHGRFSNWAHKHLKAGEYIDVMPPTCLFTWPFDRSRIGRYAMFASGSGITPILSLLKSGLKNEPKSHFALFYGNRNSDSILFLEEIHSLKDRYLERFEIHHFLSREDDELSIFNGRIDSSKMSLIIEQMLSIEQLEAAFVFGPEGMMDAVESALSKAGLDASHILSERFSAAALSDQQIKAMEELEARAAGKPIKVRLDGRTRTLEFDPAKESILENVRASGMRAPFSCKAGVCATCRARVTKGSVEMIRNFGLSEKERLEGYILTCQAIPVSEDVEIDFDQ